MEVVDGVHHQMKMVTIIDLEDVYGPINNWGVSNVTNMNELFKDKTTFNDNISGWDVSNVTSMNNMFNSATSFNKPLGSNSYVNLDPVFVAIDGVVTSSGGSYPSFTLTQNKQHRDNHGVWNNGNQFLSSTLIPVN